MSRCAAARTGAARAETRVRRPPGVPASRRAAYRSVRAGATDRLAVAPVRRRLSTPTGRGGWAWWPLPTWQTRRASQRPEPRPPRLFRADRVCSSAPQPHARAARAREPRPCRADPRRARPGAGARSLGRLVSARGRARSAAGRAPNSRPSRRVSAAPLPAGTREGRAAASAVEVAAAGRAAPPERRCRPLAAGPAAPVRCPVTDACGRPGRPRRDPASADAACTMTAALESRPIRPGVAFSLMRKSGGMLSPVRHEIAAGAELCPIRQPHGRRCARGSWRHGGSEQSAFDQLFRFAQVWELSIGMAMRLLCLVPPEWSDATLLIRARAVEPLLAWRGLAVSVVTPAKAGGGPRSHAASERHCRTASTISFSSPVLLTTRTCSLSRWSTDYPLDSAAAQRGFRLSLSRLRRSHSGI